MVLYRGPGMLLTWVLCRTKVRPIHVTAAALLTALMMPVAAYLLPLQIAGLALSRPGAIGLAPPRL